MKSKIKASPLQVYFYYPGVLNFGGVEVKITHVCIASRYFYVDIPYEEFDEQWDYLNRSIDLEEPMY